MKICYVAVDVAIPHFRGASTHVYEVAKHLAEQGHEVHVVSRRIGFTQRHHEFLNSFNVHRMLRGVLIPLPLSSYVQLKGPMEKPVGFVSRLYEVYLFTIYALAAGLAVSRIVKKHGLDIIMERETSFGVGAIASILSGRPMILEIIGPRYSKLSVGRAGKILVYTNLMIRDFVPPKKLVFVTAAVDVENFRPNLLERKGLREKLGLQDSVVVGYVGTFAKWHGIEELIDASEKVLKKFSSVRFLMVGPYYEYARRLVQLRGISNTYLFTGAVPYADVPKYINAADILVAPYNPAKSELRRRWGVGSPLKVFEYMACEKPTITTSIEPITEIIQDGETGILVPPGNSRALAEAIIHLIEKPDLMERNGKAARESVEKYYSWGVFAMNLENILKETIRAA